MVFSSMKRVEANEEWSLFCPNEAPGMADCWGEEFEALYEKYEKEGRARRTVPAQKLWYAILEAQIETGGPFMVYKDSANRTCMFVVCRYQLTPYQESLINRTLEQSSHLICAPRLSNILLLMKLLCVILLPLPFLPSSRMANTTSKNSTMSQKSLHTISTASLTPTTTLFPRPADPTCAIVPSALAFRV